MQEAGFVECGFVFCVSVTAEWAGPCPGVFRAELGPVEVYVAVECASF